MIEFKQIFDFLDAKELNEIARRAQATLRLNLEDGDHWHLEWERKPGNWQRVIDTRELPSTEWPLITMDHLIYMFFDPIIRHYGYTRGPIDVMDPSTGDVYFTYMIWPPALFPEIPEEDQGDQQYSDSDREAYWMSGAWNLRFTITKSRDADCG